MPRILIKMVSSAKTGHYYTTSKNPKKTTEKLEMVKYDPTIPHFGGARRPSRRDAKLRC